MTIDTQHVLGTIVITIDNRTSANSTMYVQASLFGKAVFERAKCCIGTGFYADVLSLVKGIGWRVVKRTLVLSEAGHDRKCEYRCAVSNQLNAELEPARKERGNTE